MLAISPDLLDSLRHYGPGVRARISSDESYYEATRHMRYVSTNLFTWFLFRDPINLSIFGVYHTASHASHVIYIESVATGDWLEHQYQLVEL